MLIHASKLHPGQLPSNLAADLRSNLFATQTVIPHQKQAHFQGI